MIQSLFIIISFLSFNIFAHEIEFIGPCSEKPILSFEIANKFESVGDLTMHVIQKNNIPHLGNERGLNSVFNTPVGLDALEVLSDTDMRSYGWCYFVDGVWGDSYADEFYLDKTDRKIQWIYSYAVFKRDRWVSMCEKAYLVKPAMFCKGK